MLKSCKPHYFHRIRSRTWRTKWQYITWRLEHGTTAAPSVNAPFYRTRVRLIAYSSPDEFIEWILLKSARFNTEPKLLHRSIHVWANSHYFNQFSKFHTRICATTDFVKFTWNSVLNTIGSVFSVFSNEITWSFWQQTNILLAANLFLVCTNDFCTETIFLAAFGKIYVSDLAHTMVIIVNCLPISISRG